MLKIDKLSLAPGEELRPAVLKILRVPDAALGTITILRRSIDAREDVRVVWSVAVDVKREREVLKRARGRRVSLYTPPERWAPPAPLSAPPAVRPVVVGAGPAGLFAALTLARAGARPLLIERGAPVEERRADVARFWETGALDPESNVQFGEGGAGAFSDGKLNTGTRDLRHRFILETFVDCGAPESILYDAKPHIGTDYLYRSLQGIRRALQEAGCEIRFRTRLTGLEKENGSLTAVRLEGPAGAETLPCTHLILAPGHSARDVFALAQDAGAALEAKPFAVGVRIEHAQHSIDAAQYRAWAGHPGLGAATYKLACHLESGRAAFSFCVCPGGTVVAAASEAGGVVTNGMSEYARAGENINGALLVNVTPEDFGGNCDPLAGVAFQRKLERAAYEKGGGTYRAVAQRVGDFLAGRPSSGPGAVKPTYRPGVEWGDISACLPSFVAETLREALPLLGRKLRGYDDPDAILTAVESRSSSPVRILRGETRVSPTLGGLYPCGEGAGYAGGILSAAADGIKTAEAALKNLAEA